MIKANTSLALPPRPRSPLTTRTLSSLSQRNYGYASFWLKTYTSLGAIWHRRLSAKLVTNKKFVSLSFCLLAILSFGLIAAFSSGVARAVVNPQSGSVGLEGTISSPPPSQGATISVPSNGQVFTNVPITVSGLCPGNVNVRIFRNGVFAGSVDCKNGSYSLQIDLFSGRNDLVARVFDSLDQAGPDSNIVTVTFNDGRGPGAGSRISLTTPYSKRGVNPGDTLSWPLFISGGNAPYAISIDWGDGSSTDLRSQSAPGSFDISHVYKKAGVYNIIIKATDKDGVSAFLQVVGLANGPPTGDATIAQDSRLTPSNYRFLLYAPPIVIFVAVSTFWLGRRYERTTLRKKLERMSARGYR
jgi:hypothetical protein